VAEYDYLDELEDAGWAWEFLRHSDEYRADYDSLRNLEAADNEHDELAEKYHVKRMLDPALPEVPEFYYEEFEQSSLGKLWQQNQHKCIVFESENKPPPFNRDPWKHSIICKDLKNQGYSLNNIAKHLYTGYKSESHETRHHPARDRVRDDLARFDNLQSAYINIAYSSTLPR
jgi:hypothetical protein